MKKLKRILAVALILALCGAGVSYAVKKTSSASVKTVEVCSVQDVNSYYGPSYQDTIEGTIISKDTQAVYLDTEHELKAVYVKEGDKVKKGDKLLEYDMLEEELNAEREDLNRRIMELELETLRQQLQILKSGRIPEAMNDSLSTDSDDYEDDYEDDYGADEDEEEVEITASADVLPVEEIPAAEPEAPDAFAAAEDTGAIEDGSTIEPDDGTDDAIPAENDDASFIVDEDDGTDLIDDGTSGTGQGGDSEDFTALMDAIYSFMEQANSITGAANESIDKLAGEGMLASIRSAMADFQTQFADSTEMTKTSLSGESVTVTDYTVSPAVSSLIGGTNASSLQKAYDRLCLYQFMGIMQQLNPTGGSSISLGEAFAIRNADLIRAAVDAVSSLPASVLDYGTLEFTDEYSSLNNPWTADGTESRIIFLLRMSDLLNGASVIEQSTEPGDEDITNSDGLDDTDWDDDGLDDGDDPVDFPAMIKEKEREIKEMELDIRESRLELKEYEDKLSKKIIYANMDGVVMQAGTLKAQAVDGAFVLVTGRAGLYVKGTINELALETVRLGDTITGTTYEGEDFTAEIVEISPYPGSSDSDYFYGFGSQNENESYYPFLAFIEDAEGLEVDTGVDMTLGGGSSMYDTEAGLSLEEFFIRKDGGGRSYCYVRGEDGLLEKRYLQLGLVEWGVATIKSGLSPDDYIAFPYGKNVREGVPTVIVDNLSAISSYY